jgi:hypothetical protein
VIGNARSTVRKLSSKVAGKRLDDFLEDLLSCGFIEHRRVETGGRPRDEYRAAELSG